MINLDLIRQVFPNGKHIAHQPQNNDAVEVYVPALFNSHIIELDAYGIEIKSILWHKDGELHIWLVKKGGDKC